MPEHATAAVASRSQQAPNPARPAPAGPTAILQSAIGNSALPSLEVFQRASLQTLQRSCCNSCGGGGNCDNEEPKLMRSAFNELTISRRELDLRGSGEVLDSSVRQDMETAFGADFSSVRVHDTNSASRAAATVNSRAFTIGQDIYFGSGYYAPDSRSGRNLIAHELTHTLQQRHAPSTSPETLTLSHPSDSSEREADAVTQRIASQLQPSVTMTAPSGVLHRDDLGSQGETPANEPDAPASPATNAGGNETNAKSSELQSKVESAISEVQGAGAASIVASESNIASLNSKIQVLNAAVPATIPLVGPAAGPVGDGLLVALRAIGTFLLGASMAEILICVAIVAAVILLILLIVHFFKESPGFGPPEIPLDPNPPAKPQPAPPQPAPPQPAPPEPAPPEPAPPQPAPPEPAPPQPAPPEPVPKPGPDPIPDPEPGPKPEPPEPEPKPPIPKPRLRCSPTGLTEADAIPMTWFKPRIDNYYPRSISLDGVEYDRDDEPTHLPHGEPIGVEEKYWPSTRKKPFHLFPGLRGPGARRFKKTLSDYGFDWAGLEPDHVQDLEFDGPDDPSNLWPMDARANKSAGSSTNNQTISFCMSPSDPRPITGVFWRLKQIPGLRGRFFRIKEIVISR